MTEKTKPALIVSTLAIILLASPGVIFAQAATALEEVVVTAQRREQSLQEVPISIEVVSGEAIHEQGFRSLEQLEGFVPSLSLTAAIRNKTLLIRGIGTDGQNMGFEQSTATFIDGIHFGRGSQIRNGFLDVERVEVLKGPQPVFFGMNAAGGALNITTRKPGEEWEGYVNSEIGNNEMRMIEAAAGGPITDTLGIRIAGKYDYSAGYLRNIWNGEPMPFREDKVLRATLRWTPSDAFDLTFKAERSTQETGGRASNIMITPGEPNPNDITNINVPGGPFSDFAQPAFGNKVPVGEFSRWGIGLIGGIVRAPEGVRDVGTGPNTGANVLDLSQVANQYEFLPAADSEPFHYILDMNYEFGNGVVLSSTTGFSKDDRFEIITDDNNFPFFAFIRTKKQEELDQLSQEIRFTSATGGSIDWMAGAFYQQEDLNTLGDQHSAQVNGRIFNHINQTQAVQDSDWLSVFGTVSLNFLDDRLSLDLGLRATQVDKCNRAFGNQAFWLAADGSIANEQDEVAVDRTPIEPNGVEVQECISNDDTNAQVVFRWRPTSQLSFYAKYADAFKAGGFDLGIARITQNREEAFSFGPELADTIEVGMKGIFLDGRAALDVSVFTETFEGLQVSGFSDVVGRQIVSNAAEQKVEGVEFSGQMQLTDFLRLNISGSLLDGTVVSFPGAQCAGQEFELGLCTGPGGTIDRSGFDALRTPDWEFTAGGNVSVPVFDRFQINVIGNFNFKDDYETVYAGGETDIGKTERINLSLGFGDINDVWEVSAWVRNLTEPLPKYDPAEDLIPDGTVIEPLSEAQFRTFGIRFQYNF